MQRQRSEPLLHNERQGWLAALSPMNYLKDIHAPLIVLLYDRGYQVIPVGESRRLDQRLSRSFTHRAMVEVLHRVVVEVLHRPA